MKIQGCGLIRFGMRFDLAMQNKWLLGGSIAGVHFPVWQTVRVIAGPHEGKAGKLISLFDLTPEPVFQMETSAGQDLHVQQSEVEGLPHIADPTKPACDRRTQLKKRKRSRI